MPYKDKKKRNELTRKHYQSNKASYIKRASIWKTNNKDKVKESRVRYSEKKKIIGELNELQISYFKTDRSKDASREFFVTYENELKEILINIISIQHSQLKQDEIEKSKLLKIVKTFYSSKNTRNVDYYNFIELVVLKKIGTKKVGSIPGRLFNSALYDPIFNLIKNDF